MTDFKTQASALLESLETQSKQTQNIAQLELLILKTTQKLGQIATQTLETNASEEISPPQTKMPNMPGQHEQKQNPNSDPENPLG